MPYQATALIDDQLRALASEPRRQILRDVAAQERPAGDIASRFDMARPSVSRHLKVLRDARLISVRAEGTVRYYRAEREAVTAIGHLFAAFWDEGLPRLKALAEAEARDRDA